jgi:hypothetical protein
MPQPQFAPETSTLEWGPSSSRFGLHYNLDNVPRDALVFAARAEAAAFAKTWKGHPWWCVPKSYEIVELLPKTRTVPDGYAVVGSC